MYLSPLLQGGKRTGLINQIFIWSVLCDPMWSTGTRLFCTPRFYSSGSVNQKVEPEPFTESTPIASFKLSMMVLLIVFRNIRLLKYIDVDIHTFSIKEIQISLLLNSVYICSYRDNYWYSGKITRLIRLVREWIKVYWIWAIPCMKNSRIFVYVMEKKELKINADKTSWYVLYTAPRAEKQVRDRIDALGVECCFRFIVRPGFGLTVSKSWSCHYSTLICSCGVPIRS